jgi:hypothetical protein
MKSKPAKPEAAAFSQSELRPLQPAEIALLKWLLANGNPDARKYENQTERLRVVGRCTCGCPTVDLATGERDRRTVGPSNILADFAGVTAEGVEVGVILHAREGQISELEIYSLTDKEGPFGLPTIESLRT